MPRLLSKIHVSFVSVLKILTDQFCDQCLVNLKLKVLIKWPLSATTTEKSSVDGLLQKLVKYVGCRYNMIVNPFWIKDKYLHVPLIHLKSTAMQCRGKVMKMCHRQM